jgi:DNA-binding IclR family transcriptional regulator
MADQEPLSTAKKPGIRRVKSAERVLDLLEIFGANAGGVSFARLVQLLGIPKSSLFALVETMEARGYIVLNSESRKYTLSIRTWEIGQAFQRNNNILEHADAILVGVVEAVNETAQLAKLVGNECVYLAKKESTHPLRLQSDVGMRLQAHATGVGKAMLAQLDDADVSELFETTALPVFTPQTLVDMTILLTDLSATRARGFAVDNEEYTPGVFCLAVPIYEALGNATAALSVTVPITRATPDGLAGLLAAISRGSCEMSTRLGRIQLDPMLMKLSDPAAAAIAISTLIFSGRYNLNFE